MTLPEFEEAVADLGNEFALPLYVQTASGLGRYQILSDELHHDFSSKRVSTGIEMGAVLRFARTRLIRAGYAPVPATHPDGDALARLGG